MTDRLKCLISSGRITLIRQDIVGVYFLSYKPFAVGEKVDSSSSGILDVNVELPGVRMGADRVASTTGG